MERRDLLTAAGISGATGLLGIGLYAAISGSPDDRSGPEEASPTDSEAEETTRPTDRPDRTPETDHRTVDRGDDRQAAYETVVDAVENGADPTGEDPVTDLVETHADDETLLAFEPGTYRIDYFELAELTGLGIAGVGDEPARFVPAAGTCRGGHPWIFFDRIDDLHLENLTVDFRDADQGGPMHLFLDGDAVLRDLTVRGSCSNQISMLRIQVASGGRALCENVHASNDGNDSLTGIYVGTDHAGELRLRDCRLERFSDNGLYASAPGAPDGGNGTVSLEGGDYANNNVSNVRLGTTGSTAREVAVRVDAETPGWGGLNARGIRLRRRSGQVIEDCAIEFGPDAADSFGGVVFHQANGGARVVDTTITVDRGDIPAVRAFPLEGTSDEAPVFEGCTITGSASTGPTAHIEGRDGTVFRDCTIEQRDRRGLLVVDSTDCRIVDSHIEVDRAPVAVENGRVTIENTTVRTADGERTIDERVLENETLEIDGA